MNLTPERGGKEGTQRMRDCMLHHLIGPATHTPWNLIGRNATATESHGPLCHRFNTQCSAVFR